MKRLPRDVWLIIPAYNEAKHVSAVLKKCKAYTDNVVLVDDGSSDKTQRCGERCKVISLRHEINLGKGAALKTGCDYAYVQGAKRFVVLDSDGQHKPEEIPHLLDALKGNDIVFGARGRNEQMPKLFKFGNWGINMMTKVLYGIELSDTQGGFRAFTRKAYEKIRWVSTGYSVESEMIANAGRAGMSYAEVPIETIYLDRYKGTTVLDGLKIGLNLLLWRLRWS